MRFFVESHATIDRGDIDKDDSLVRNVGFGQIEQIIGSIDRSIDKDIIDINNDNFTTVCIVKDNKKYEGFVDQLEEKICVVKKFNQEDKITREKYEEKRNYEKEDVAIDEISDIWECTSSIPSTSFFEYMRILFASPLCH